MEFLINETKLFAIGTLRADKINTNEKDKITPPTYKTTAISAFLRFVLIVDNTS